MLSGISSECQTVWIQILPKVYAGLIRVQNIRKDTSWQTVNEDNSSKLL